MQVIVTNKEVIARAASAIRTSRKHKKDYRVDVILLALQGKTVDFRILGLLSM